MKDNLDGFQKLVSTRWTFSISISIGLDRRDPQPYLYLIMLFKQLLHLSMSTSTFEKCNENDS